MKKLILIAIALIGIQGIAQEKEERGPRNHDRNEKMMDLTAEEIATLQTKKMTLFLDLSPTQQGKIHKINLENATNRKAMMEERKAKKESGEDNKPTKEERLKIANERLDHKIAMKAKMKDILNNDQYAKWEESQAKKGKGKRGSKKDKEKK